MLAIAIRYALDVAHEVYRALHVLQPFARCQAKHPADERAVDARSVIGWVRVPFGEGLGSALRTV